jgi:hypothetical protein
VDQGEVGNHATARGQGQAEALEQERGMDNGHIFVVGERACQFWATDGSPGHAASGVICYDGNRPPPRSGDALGDFLAKAIQDEVLAAQRDWGSPA